MTARPLELALEASFEQLSEHAYAYTAEGDPNTGVIPASATGLRSGGAVAVEEGGHVPSLPGLRGRPP